MQDEHSTNPHETPPVNTRWRNVYILVVVFLVLQIVLYFLFMKSFE